MTHSNGYEWRVPSSSETREDPEPEPRAPGYLPIEHHGLIGDLRTCALVGTDGTIDWFCAPRFDSPSVFGGLLDPDRGGAWRLEALDDNVRTSQFYLPDSNILVTRFMTAARAWRRCTTSCPCWAGTTPTTDSGSSAASPRCVAPPASG